MIARTDTLAGHVARLHDQAESMRLDLDAYRRGDPVPAPANPDQWLAVELAALTMENAR